MLRRYLPGLLACQIPYRLRPMVPEIQWLPIPRALPPEAEKLPPDETLSPEFVVFETAFVLAIVSLLA